MLAETCATREVPDCEFFVNKRDYPQLKFHMNENQSNTGFPVEPYGFIYDKDDTDPTEDIPLTRHAYKSYAPILSFYTSDRFADIAIPPSEDWEAATGEVFPPSFIYEEVRNKDGTTEIITANPRDLFTVENLKKFEIPWGEKVPTAFFRGTATGGGVTIQNNQRLHVAQISYEWSLHTHKHLRGKINENNDKSSKQQPKAKSIKNKNKSIDGGEINDDIKNDDDVNDNDNNGDNDDTNDNDDENENENKIKIKLKNEDDNFYPYLDAKITGWNMRDKKTAHEKMTFIKKDDFPFEGDRKKNFVEIYKQGTYKYLLYVEGHCAACRYGFMMQLGSVILKVDSLCVADQMWYFPLLVPFRDHVPVKSDLSDLEEKIKWCRDNDDKCKIIAKNAQELYKLYVSRDGILDYMQAVCVETAKKCRSAPVWAADPPAVRSAPCINRWHEMGLKCTRIDNEPILCSTCEKMRLLEEEQLASQRQNHALNTPKELSKSELKNIDLKRIRQEKKDANILKAEKLRKLGDSKETVS
mmetsp:Transcript_32418/g.30923  ORF Transcript_32418/g.30923 Transcript_32418/m.30923 type:complete len:527 (+) Transcript_32418:216-1796(+)